MVPFTGVGNTRGKRNKITSFWVGTRMKSFTLAILSLRCPLDVQVAMPSRPVATQIRSPGEAAAGDTDFEVLSVHRASKHWECVNRKEVFPFSLALEVGWL